MRVPILGMSLAMEKVSDLAANDSNAPGVLLKLGQGTLDVCYSNGRKAVVEKLEVVNDEGDLTGNIVVPYKRLADIIATLQPSGRITTSDIDIKFESQELEGIMEVSASKYLIMYHENGEAEGKQMELGDSAEGTEGSEAVPRVNFDSEEFQQEAASQEMKLTAAAPQGAEGQGADNGADGAGQADGADGYYEEVCTVSEFHQRVNYYDPTKQAVKFGILTRMDYDSIFVGDDGETNGDFDVWELSELRSLLTRMALEKNRTIYASHAHGSVFVVNLAYTSWVKTASVVDNGFTVDTGMAKSVVDILGSMAKTGETKVLVKKKDERYVCIAGEHGKAGLWFEMVAPSRTDSATLQTYKNKDYNGFRVLFSREALENVLASAISTDKVEKTTLTFVVQDTSIAMRINSVNSGASVNNTFDVISCGNNIGMENMLKEKLSVSLKTLMDMVKNCVGDFVEIAVDIPADQKERFMRIGDVEFGDNGYEPGMSGLTCAHYCVTSEA